MKKVAVIVAAGNGNRMNQPVPKQFLLLHNKPVLYYSINTFFEAYNDISIILVLPPEHLENGQQIINEYFPGKKISITEGGPTRFHSVQNGLRLVDEECIVFVHDGVRCLVTKALVHRCYDAAVESGTAIPVIDSKDSIRLVTEKGNMALERSQVKLVQTPQTFHSKILLPAYRIDYKDKFTDEAMVVEAFGMKVHLVDGESSNIKITTPPDLVFAEQQLIKNQEGS